MKWKESYTIDVTYEESKTNSGISNYFNKLNNFFSRWIINILYRWWLIINYYLTCAKSEL